MKKTYLFMTLHIPVTYDETKMTEEQAKDVVQQKVQEAVDHAIEGRNIAPDGTYLDCSGPKLVETEEHNEKE
jgi:hypothetical protein